MSGANSRTPLSGAPPVYRPASPSAAANVGWPPPVYHPAQAALAQTVLQQKPKLIGPPVYRPQQAAPSAQPRTGGAPPVYRPTKTAPNQTAVQQKSRLIGPPVYRPQQAAPSAQRKIGGAPPVYRPQTASFQAQLRSNVAQPKAGSHVVQRLSIKAPIEWDKCKSVTTSSVGATGVFFFHEKVRDPATTIIVKSDDVPAGNYAIARTLHKRMGGGRAPKSRALDPAEARKARELISDKVDWAQLVVDYNQKNPTKQMSKDGFRQAKLNKFDNNPYKIVMEMVAGHSHEEFVAKTSLDEVMDKLDDAFWSAIGAMAVVDIFVEHEDRLHSVNLGNWMLHSEGISPIDNVDKFRLEENTKGKHKEAEEQRWFDKISPDKSYDTATIIVDEVLRKTMQKWVKTHPGESQRPFALAEYEHLDHWKWTVAKSIKTTREKMIMELASRNPSSWVTKMSQHDNERTARILKHAQREQLFDQLGQLDKKYGDDLGL